MQFLIDGVQTVVLLPSECAHKSRKHLMVSTVLFILYTLM